MGFEARRDDRERRRDALDGAGDESWIADPAGPAAVDVTASPARPAIDVAVATGSAGRAAAPPAAAIETAKPDCPAPAHD